MADETNPAVTEQPPAAVLDALEKLLEGELPMTTFLAVQVACAAIREHLQ